MFKPGTYISCDWYKSHEGREVIMSIMHRNMHRRKTFGLLEKPSLPPTHTPDEFKYKIFVCGKCAVGKTSTVAKLSGNEVPLTHCETPGIQTSVVYWPARVIQMNKVVMFKIEFWDAGENALKKFDHVMPACKEHTDGIIFVYSFTDKASFEDLPHQMARIIEPTDDFVKFVMGTKYDLHAHSEIAQREVIDFQQQWKIPVLRIHNVTDYRQNEVKTELNEVAPILNTLCEHLWYKDQLLAGRLPSSTELSNLLSDSNAKSSLL